MTDTDFAQTEIDRRSDLLIPAGAETIAATRWKPAIDGPLPVVIMANPYRKDDDTVFATPKGSSLEYIAKHGYEVLAVDIPGTGASSGTRKRAFNHPGESVAAAIEWLADQPWSTGRVGMYGISWGGLSQLQAASVSPEPLKAIIPVASPRSPYGFLYKGGAFNAHKGPTWATQMAARQALPPSRRDADGRWAEIWRERLDDIGQMRPWLFDWFAHELKDDWWREQDVQVEPIDVPTFAVSGYRDPYILSPATTEYFSKIDAPKRLLLGPWGHVTPHVGYRAPIDFRRKCVEWYDHFLKDKDTGVMDRPAVEYWTERNGGWEKDGGHWRVSDHWPEVGQISDSRALSFAITDNGLENASEFDGSDIQVGYEHDASVGIHSVQSLAGVTHDGGDTTEDDDRSLTFETRPLENPVEYTGNGHVYVRLQDTTPEPVVVARVNDVKPDGTAKPVTNGHMKASHRESHRNPTPLTPGDEYGVTIPLRPRSHVFEQGHRIRVSVSAALFPRVLASAESGTLTIHSSPDDPSVLRFPGKVHEGSVEFDDTIRMEPPDDDVVTTESEYVIDSHEDWEVDRDEDGDIASFVSDESASVAVPGGPTLHTMTKTESSVNATDPTTATIKNEAEYALEYESETVSSKASSLVTHNYATLSIRVTVDEQTIFQKDWVGDGI